MYYEKNAFWKQQRSLLLIQKIRKNKYPKCNHIKVDNPDGSKLINQFQNIKQQDKYEVNTFSFSLFSILKFKSERN